MLAYIYKINISIKRVVTNLTHYFLVKIALKIICTININSLCENNVLAIITHTIFLLYFHLGYDNEISH